MVKGPKVLKDTLYWTLKIYELVKQRGREQHCDQVNCGNIHSEREKTISFLQLLIKNHISRKCFEFSLDLANINNNAALQTSNSWPHILHEYIT